MELMERGEGRQEKVQYGNMTIYNSAMPGTDPEVVRLGCQCYDDTIMSYQ